MKNELKTEEMNMQEMPQNKPLFIEIIGTDDRKNSQVSDIDHIFNKIVDRIIIKSSENKKSCIHSDTRAYNNTTQTRKGIFHVISVKKTVTQNKERESKEIRHKTKQTKTIKNIQAIYKDKHIKITVDCSTQTQKASRACK